MNTLKKALLFLSCLLLTPLISFAQDASSIQSAFLDIGFGTRPATMGNAYVGMADDVNSVYLNPAGLTSLTENQATFTHTRLMGLVDYNFLTTGIPLPGGPHAAGLAIISSGDNIMREISVHLAYARKFGPLSAGAAIKGRYSSFGNNTLHHDSYFGVFDPDEIDTGIGNQIRGTGSGFGLDLGLIYQPAEELRFGLFVRDLVAPFSWDSRTASGENQSKGNYNERIPMEIAVGSSYRVTESFTISTEYRPTFDEEQDHALRIGAETILLDILALRAGTEQWINNLDDDKYMLGMGIITPEISGLSASVNYGYIIDNLANTHRFGLMLHF